jgi:periplasmic divalent cation tolerance protein
MTTCCGENAALTIAEALVDQKLAACVSIIPGVKSYYFYDGSTHLDEEVKLVIKTHASLFGKASALITKLHAYEVPEILMLKVEDGSEPFLAWISKTVQRQ